MKPITETTHQADAYTQLFLHFTPIFDNSKKNYSVEIEAFERESDNLIFFVVKQSEQKSLQKLEFQVMEHNFFTIEFEIFPKHFPKNKFIGCISHKVQIKQINKQFRSTSERIYVQLQFEKV